jgi:hypothetical protein
VALVLGPSLLLAGALIHPKEVPDAGDQLRIAAGALNRWYVAHLFYIAATALFVPGVLAIGRRLREAAPRMELWGTGLAVVGLFSTAGLVALEGIGGWLLAQLTDRGAATQAYDRISHSAGVVVPFAIVGLTLSAGLLVLAVGLVRTATAPAWSAWTLGAGALLLAIGLVAEVHVAFVAGVVGIFMAMAATGLADLGLTSSAPEVGSRSAAVLAANG